MKYVTEKNLKQLWERVDNMLSEWYNMTELFGEMKFKADDETFGLYNLIDRFDPSHLILIKNTIEQLIEEKEAK